MHEKNCVFGKDAILQRLVARFESQVTGVHAMWPGFGPKNTKILINFMAVVIAKFSSCMVFNLKLYNLPSNELVSFFVERTHQVIRVVNTLKP